MATYAEFLLSLEAHQSNPSPYSGDNVSEILIDMLLGSGTSANQFDQLHRSTRDPGATTAEDVDVRLLEDSNGVVMSGLTEIVLLIVQAPSTNTLDYEIKPGAANGWLGLLKDASDIILVPPGETKVLVCNFSDGKNVIGATTKILNINNLGDADSELEFFMLSRSA